MSAEEPRTPKEPMTVGQVAWTVASVTFLVFVALLLRFGIGGLLTSW